MRHRSGSHPHLVLPRGGDRELSHARPTTARGPSSTATGAVKRLTALGPHRPPLRVTAPAPADTSRSQGGRAPRHNHDSQPDSHLTPQPSFIERPSPRPACPGRDDQVGDDGRLKSRRSVVSLEGCRSHPAAIALTRQAPHVRRHGSIRASVSRGIPRGNGGRRARGLECINTMRRPAAPADRWQRAPSRSRSARWEWTGRGRAPAARAWGGVKGGFGSGELIDDEPVDVREEEAALPVRSVHARCRRTHLALGLFGQACCPRDPRCAGARLKQRSRLRT